MAGIREEGEYSGNALRARDFAGVDHYTDLHEGSVDLSTPSVDDINIVFADGLDDADVTLPNSTLSHVRPCERDTESESTERQTFALRNVGAVNEHRLAMTSASSGWLVPARRIEAEEIKDLDRGRHTGEDFDAVPSEHGRRVKKSV